MYQNKYCIMKNSFRSVIIPIMVLSFGFVLFNGCAKINPKAYDYLLLLNIHDSYGVDVIEDIPNTKSEGFLVVEDKDGWIGEVNPEVYKLNITLPSPYYGQGVPNPEIPLSVTRINNKYYLVLKVNHINKLPDDELTFKLTCSHVFDDSEEHIIVSYWREGGLFSLSGDYTRTECYRITIDGIEWPVEQELFVPNFSDEIKKQLALTNNENDFTRFISVAKIIL